MKKAVLIVMLLTVLISALNFPIYIYHNFGYFPENDIKQEIADDLEFYQSDNISEGFRKYYGTDLSDLLKSLLANEYRVLSKIEAIKLIYFNDVDKNSRETSAPMNDIKNYDIIRLTRLKIFEVDGITYLLSTYSGPDGYNYTVFECSYKEETEQIFERDCFSDGSFESDKQTALLLASIVTLKRFLPVIIAALILFLPTFTEGKRSTNEARKLAKIMAKIGIIVIPVFIIIMYMITYLR